MPWLDGEPPRDGKPHVCETPSHDGPLILRWFKYNGLEAWRDWDNDAYTDVRRWHPIEEQSSKRFSAEKAIEIACAACSKAFDQMAESDLLDEQEFNGNMAIYIGAAFKEAEKTKS